jgi:thymidylate synthase (FAD)
MTYQSDVLNDPRYVPVLDHGFVGLIDIMGDDKAIDEAARTSYGLGTRSVSDMRNLIRYLIRNYHTSPLEMVELKFHLKMPIFVMRQHVRHRTANLNEYSGRYSIMTDEMYVPELERFQGQHPNNKQASGEFLGEDIAESLLNDLKESYKITYQNYKKAIDQGLAREVARIQLPLATYTELYWKIDLKNFFHYVKLRNDPKHAQKEIVLYADAMYNLVKPKLPIACEAFEDYWLNGVSFSRMEMDLLKRLISFDKWLEINEDFRDEKGIAKAFGLTDRELKEFNEKLEINW